MPYPQFDKSAKCLDYRRLGKQRSEALFLLNDLLSPNPRWANWPQNKMWKGYEHALSAYGIEICREWKKRGYVDYLLPTFERIYESILKSFQPNMSYYPEGDWDRFVHDNIIIHVDLPLWIYDERVFASHRAALLFKDYKYYSEFGWTEIPEIKYFWPVR